MRTAFDLVGMALSGTSLACLMFGFELASRGATSPIQTASIVLIGVFSGALYIRHALRTPAAILDLKLMRVRSFALSVVGGGFTRNHRWRVALPAADDDATRLRRFRRT